MPVHSSLLPKDITDVSAMASTAERAVSYATRRWGVRNGTLAADPALGVYLTGVKVMCSSLSPRMMNVDS